MDPYPLWALAIVTLLGVLLAIEGGFRLGRAAHARADHEKESPVSAITATIMAMLAFIMAFMFGIVSDRYDARKALVLQEANAIRTAWLRADFLPAPDRAAAASLLRAYVDGRITAVQSGDMARVQTVEGESRRLQRRLWDMAVVNARKDMNSDVAALYIESVNDLASVHASRTAIGIHARIPTGIWLALFTLVLLSMVAVGYHSGIADSRRSWVMLILALSFTLVVALIAALDRAQGGYLPVSQQPLEEVRATMAEGPP